MKSFVFVIASVLFLISCEEMPTTVATEPSIVNERTLIIDTAAENISIQKHLPQIDAVKTAETQKNIAKVENSFSAKSSFGDIHIHIEQKQNLLYINSNSEVVEDFSIAIKGTVTTFIQTDLNADAYNEFYCITNAGDLLAFSSYRNKSFGEIYIPQKPFDFYKNFNELKFWEVKNNKLLLTFSNGENEALNVVRYHLKAGETGFKLIAE